MKEINLRIRIVKVDEVEVYEEIYDKDKKDFEQIDTYLFTMLLPYNKKFLFDYVEHLQNKYHTELEI